MATKIDRTTDGLREHLFMQLERLSDGAITAQEVREHTKLAQQIANISRLDIDAARFVSEQRALESKEEPTQLKPLSLGKSGA